MNDQAPSAAANTPSASTHTRAPTTSQIRRATPDDADALVQLVDIAGEGLASYLWDLSRAEGQSVWDYGRERALRESGAFSYRNADLIDAADGSCGGCLICYAIPEVVEPIPDDMPAMFRPLQELENLAPGTWYVNVLAVFEQYRGKGYGSALLNHADGQAAEAGLNGLSIIVSDANTGARRLYTRHGFVERASRPKVKDGWKNDGQNWILMTKPA